MAQHVHRGLALFQDDIPDQRFVLTATSRQVRRLARGHPQGNLPFSNRPEAAAPVLPLVRAMCSSLQGMCDGGMFPLPGACRQSVDVFGPIV